jgi:hypothetical protein
MQLSDYRSRRNFPKKAGLMNLDISMMYADAQISTEAQAFYLLMEAAAKDYAAK